MNTIVVQNKLRSGGIDSSELTDDTNNICGIVQCNNLNPGNNTTITLTANANEGYKFLYWIVEGIRNYNNWESIDIENKTSSNITYYYTGSSVQNGFYYLKFTAVFAKELILKVDNKMFVNNRTKFNLSDSDLYPIPAGAKIIIWTKDINKTNYTSDYNDFNIQVKSFKEDNNYK